MLVHRLVRALIKSICNEVRDVNRLTSGYNLLTASYEQEVSHDNFTYRGVIWHFERGDILVQQEALAMIENLLQEHYVNTVVIVGENCNLRIGQLP